MSPILRAGLLLLIVLGLALAGSVQASRAEALASVLCSNMPMDGDGPETPRPDPAKACAIILCPTAPPAVAEAAEAVQEPVFHAARPVMRPSATTASADPAPEQRPPIS